MSVSLVAIKAKNKLVQAIQCKFRFLLFIIVVVFLCVARVDAQQKVDTSNTIAINIESAKTFIQTKTEQGIIFRFYNDVKLVQGTNRMSCDTAYLNQDANEMEAFGNVVITQVGGTMVSSNYLRYTGNTKQAFLRGNVNLSDGKNNLWSEILNYDLGTKIGNYQNGGTLTAEQTTVSSKIGQYFVQQKQARFIGDVIVTDPQYHVSSNDLGYNTETKIVRFFGPSTIKNEKSKLITSSGTWDGKNEIANFTERSSIEHENQYIEADTLDYSKSIGISIAKGNVYAKDTSMKLEIYCGYSKHNELLHQTIAYQNPVLKKATEKDSIYARADTFFIAPVLKKIDTSKLENTFSKLEKLKVKKVDSLSNNDSSIQRYFIGYNHVLIYSDSLQAVCDSMSYSQHDSTFRMMGNPIAWARGSQLTGDSIFLYLENNKLTKLWIPNNAFSVSKSGPDKAEIFDQIQGKTITGFFNDDALREIVVYPNAEAIYFATDDAGAYIGVNKSNSDRLKAFFDSSKIEKIILEQEVKQTMTPLSQINAKEMRLDRFTWVPERRPKSVSELFLYKNDEPDQLPIVEKQIEIEALKQDKKATNKKKKLKK